MREIFVVLYDLLFILAGFYFLLKYFLRGRVNKEIFKRLQVPENLPSYLQGRKSPIWLHAVSVGEVASLEELINSLKRSFPEHPLLLSTITSQGKELAEKLYKDKVFIFYLPLDLSFIIKKAVSVISPKIFIGVETEIWPNLYYFLSKKNIPIIILNGRISQKSFKFYKLVKPLLRVVLREVSFITAQDKISEERFLSLGAESSKLKVTGNMKFKSRTFSEDKLSDFKKKWQVLKNREECLLVAGSTHPPEEEILLSTFKDIRKVFPKFKLLICPRHIERAEKIAQLVQKFGFEPTLVSKIKDRDNLDSLEKRVFILDTVGELIYFYSLADITFVGGSLSKYGGHNILEPAYFSKPVIFGQYMFNFEEIRRVFLENKAGLEVKNEEELKSALLRLLTDKVFREELGRRAKNILESSESALRENFEVLKCFLENSTLI